MKLSIANNSDDLISQYNNLKSGHFFDKDTMRFFKSRVLSFFQKIDNSRAIFLTSEKKCFDDYSRVFSVRLAELKSDDSGNIRLSISTLESQLNSLSSAKTFVKNYIKNLNN